MFSLEGWRPVLGLRRPSRRLRRNMLQLSKKFDFLFFIFWSSITESRGCTLIWIWNTVFFYNGITTSISSWCMGGLSFFRNTSRATRAPTRSTGVRRRNTSRATTEAATAATRGRTERGSGITPAPPATTSPRRRASDKSLALLYRYVLQHLFQKASVLYSDFFVKKKLLRCIFFFMEKNVDTNNIFTVPVWQPWLTIWKWWHHFFKLLNYKV